MRNKSFTKIYIVFYDYTLAQSCQYSHDKEILQEGDLLFKNLNCGELRNANEVNTDGVNGKKFRIGQWW